MKVKELIKELQKLEDQEAPIFIDFNTDPSAGLNAVEVNKVYPFKPFWTKVGGYLIE